MNRKGTWAGIGLMTVFLFFSVAIAGDMSSSEGHGKMMKEGSKAMEKMDHSGHGAHGEMGSMGHADRAGDNIRNTTVDGYKLAYHLIDMREKMKAMKEQGHTHKMSSHHLMIYVNDPDGKPVGSAKAGFLVTAPNTPEQKVMGMAMGVGGYGGDLDFSTPGDYSVTSKIVIGDKTVKDSFTYSSK